MGEEGLMKLSKEERELLNQLAKAHSIWCGLVRQHPQEMDEWVLSFHRLQDLVLARPTVRCEGLVKRVTKTVSVGRE